MCGGSEVLRQESCHEPGVLGPLSRAVGLLNWLNSIHPIAISKIVVAVVYCFL